MKNKLTLLIVSLIFGLALHGVSFAAEDYSSTINVFRESPAVSKFFRESYGYAVFPNIGKAGYVIGGAYGTGQVYTHERPTGRISVIEGSIGFQFGGEAFSEIIFFQNKQAYDEFISGNFEFSATAQAVVITAGAQAEVGTTGNNAGASAGPKTSVQAETNYTKGMATFVHPLGGLMYEASVGGQRFTYEPL